jgi:hypothetical protein
VCALAGNIQAQVLSAAPLGTELDCCQLGRPYSIHISKVPLFQAFVDPLCDFPVKNTLYTLHIYGSGQPYILVMSTSTLPWTYSNVWSGGGYVWLCNYIHMHVHIVYDWQVIYRQSAMSGLRLRFHQQNESTGGSMAA